MAGSVFDSAVFADLFPTGEVGRLFTDSATIRAMLLVEGALAKVQGTQGIIPTDSAAAIHRATMEVQIDPGSLAKATGQNGVAVPALLAAFRDEMQAPEHAQYVHWGATSQDIIDTGLMLRLRQALELIEANLGQTLTTFGRLAKTHANLPMAARTYGQHATPTSFGAVVAEWGRPLLGLMGELPDLRDTCLLVSLSGAAGTASALGPEAAQTRAGLANALGLNDPGAGWQPQRYFATGGLDGAPDTGAWQAGRRYLRADPERNWRTEARRGWRVFDHAAKTKPGGTFSACGNRAPEHCLERRTSGCCDATPPTRRSGVVQ